MDEHLLTMDWSRFSPDIEDEAASMQAQTTTSAGVPVHPYASSSASVNLPLPPSASSSRAGHSSTSPAGSGSNTAIGTAAAAPSASAHANPSTNTNTEVIRPEDVPRAPKPPLWKRRWFIIANIVGALLGIAILFILLYPVVHAIAQHIVNVSVLNVDRVEIVNPSNTS